MSEEEIIMLLIRFICPTVHFKRDKIHIQDSFGFDMGYFSAIEIQKAVQGLLDLYNEEKEKNKKLKEKCKELIKEKQELTTVLEDDVIPKSKVKEKIEELNSMKVDGEVFITAVNFAKKILQELL